MEFLEEAQKAGSADAAYNLGVIYFRGDGVSENVEKAMELFEQAHRDGHAGAARFLMDKAGHGVAQDPGAARALFEQAHKAGHPLAASKLGTTKLPDPHAKGAASEDAKPDNAVSEVLQTAPVIGDYGAHANDPATPSMWLGRK